MLRILALVFCLIGCTPLWAQSLEEYPVWGSALPVVKDSKWGYIDTCGDWVIKPMFEWAGNFNPLNYAVVKQNGQYRVLTPELKLKYTADSIITLGHYAIIGNEGRYGFFSLKDSMILPPQYDDIHLYGTNLLACDEGKCVLVDKKGKFLIEEPFEYIHALGDSSLLVYANEKFGLYSNSGKQKLPVEYDEISWHNDSIIRFRKGGKWGYMRHNNRILTPAQWDDMEMISPELCKLKRDTGYVLMNYLTGKQISNSYSDYFHGKDGLVVAKDYHNKIGAINYQNQVVIPPQYEELNLLNEKFFIFGDKGKYGVLDSAGNEILPALFSLIEEYYTYDMLQNTATGKQFFRLYENFMVGLANSSGQVVIPPRYSDISIRTDNFYITNFRSYFGLYNDDGKEVFPTEYEYIGRLEDGTIMARVGNCYAIANKDTLLSGPINDKIVVENNVAKLYKDGNIEILEMDENGKVEYRYTYNDIPSLNVAVKDVVPPKMVPFNSNRFLSEFYEWKFYQPTGKWGVMDLKTNSWYQKPTYDKVYRTVYDRIWITEIETDSLTVDLAGLKFITNKLYGTYNLYEGFEEKKPELVYLDMPKSHHGWSTEVNNTGFDPGLHKSGIFMYAAGIEENRYYPIAFIGERYNNTRRYNSKGKLHATADSTIKTVASADEFYFRLNRSANISFADPATKKALFENKTYFSIPSGKWHYRHVRAIDTKDHFAREFFEAVSEPTTKGLIIKQGGYGIVNYENTELVSTTNQYITAFNFWEKGPMYALGTDNSFFSFIDENGNGVENGYEDAGTFSEGLAPVMNKGKWGFIDKGQELVIPQIYDEVGPFNEGLALAKKEDRYGYINKKGEEVIPFKFKAASDFENGQATVKEDNRYGIINAKGEWTTPDDFTSDFKFNHKGFAVVKSNGKKGVINAHGEMVLNQGKFKKLELVGYGNLAVAKSGKWNILYDLETGKKVKGRFKVLEDGGEGGLVKFKPKKSSLYGFLDSDGNEIIQPFLKRVGEFHEGLANARDGKNWGYINTKGEFVIEAKFDGCGDFNNGIAQAMLEGEDVLINKQGQVILELGNRQYKGTDCKGHLILGDEKGTYIANNNGHNIFGDYYEKIKVLDDGKLVVKQQGLWGVINQAGQFRIKPKFADINDFSGGQAKVKISPLEGLVDWKGDVLVEPKYEKCIPVTPYIFRVEKTGKVGYVKKDNQAVWPLGN